MTGVIEGSIPLGSSGTTDHNVPEQKSTSFYGRKYKEVTVFGDFLSSAITALFYKIISFASWILCLRSETHRYGELAHYHSTRAQKLLGAYVIFEDRIINFSTNGIGRVTELRRDNVNELEELLRIYGKKFNEMLQGVSTDTIPIDNEKLSLLTMQDGICLGLSLDFISRFLHSTLEEENWFETIENISHLFVDGGTEKAQIIQILYHAQKLDDLQKTMQSAFDVMKKQRDSVVGDTIKEGESFLQEMKKFEQKIKEIEIKSDISVDDKKKQIEKITEEKKAFSRSFGLEFVNMANQKINRYVETNRALHDIISKKRCLPLAGILDVDLDVVGSFIYKCGKESAPTEDLKQLFQKLEKGAYLVTRHHWTESIGHAIAYIKESNERGYLCDPSLATVVMESENEQSAFFQKLTQGYFKDEDKDDYSLTFFRCNKTEPKGDLVWDDMNGRL